MYPFKLLLSFGGSSPKTFIEMNFVHLVFGSIVLPPHFIRRQFAKNIYKNELRSFSFWLPKGGIL